MERKVPDLPKQMIKENDDSVHTKGFLSEYVGKPDSYIKKDMCSSVKSDIDDLEFLLHVITICNKSTICTTKYDELVLLEKYYKNKHFSLLDDYENKDRSYINVDEFRSNKIKVPLAYVMWNPKFKNEVNVGYTMTKNFEYHISNADNTITKETLLRLKEFVKRLKDIPQTDIEKIMLISNYLQYKVQYVEPGGKTTVEGKTYYAKCDPSLMTREATGSINTVINHGCGLCTSIANTSTLLLNNPEININARTVRGGNHAWNLVNVDGKNYYVDNTWCITRNPNKYEDMLKATEFTDKYLLFGSDTANRIGHHDNIISYVPNIEKDDYSRAELEANEKTLSRKVKLKYR